MTRTNAHRSPEFIGIGFRRCGTSWLHACLSEHPEIGKPHSGLHFFSNEENYQRGIDWYQKQLQRYSEKRILGEFSVSYTYPDVYEQVAYRILEHYPQVKIVCTVRKPVERAYSDYLRSVSLSEVNKNVTFEEAIQIYPEFVTRGFYGRILRRYRDYLSDRLLVLFFDDLKANPRRFIEQIYAFLGVDSNYVPPMVTENRGRVFMPKNQRVQRLITTTENVLSHHLRSRKLGFVLDGIKALGIQHAVRKLNRVEGGYMSSDTEHMLRRLYHDDIEELGALVNKDLSLWQESVE